MEAPVFGDEQRTISKELMERECKNLISEIERLEKRREMLSSLLKNSMDIAYATVNIEDSRQTRTLTEATVRDSAAMRQVFFFPSSNCCSDEILADFIPDNGLLTGQLPSRKRRIFYVGPI